LHWIGDLRIKLKNIVLLGLTTTGNELRGSSLLF